MNYFDPLQRSLVHVVTVFLIYKLHNLHKVPNADKVVREISTFYFSHNLCKYFICFVQEVISIPMICPDLLGIYNFVLKPSKNIYKMFIKHKKRRGELWISIIII